MAGYGPAPNQSHPTPRPHRAKAAVKVRSSRRSFAPLPPPQRRSAGSHASRRRFRLPGVRRLADVVNRAVSYFLPLRRCAQWRDVSVPQGGRNCSMLRNASFSAKCWYSAKSSPLNGFLRRPLWDRARCPSIRSHKPCRPSSMRGSTAAADNSGEDFRSASVSSCFLIYVPYTSTSARCRHALRVTQIRTN